MMTPRLAPACALLVVAGCGSVLLAPEHHDHDHGHDHVDGHGHGNGHGHDDHEHARASPQDAGADEARAFLLGPLAPRADEPPALQAARAELHRALEAHEFPAAVAAAGRVLEVRPRDPAAHLLLSDALVELGRLDEAEAALQTVLDLRPGATSYFRAGWLLHLRGQEGPALEALELAREAARTSPPAARAWILTQTADLCRAAGRPERAAALYRQALSLAPRWEPAHLGLARAALAQGDPWEATRALAEVRPSVEGLHLEARARRALGQAERASVAVRRAVALGRGDAHDARALALLLADEGLSPRRALELASSEVGARPGPHSWDALAWALLRAGHAAPALVAAERALAWGTREPELLWHAGQAARAAGDPRADAWLRDAVSLDPSLAALQRTS